MSPMVTRSSLPAMRVAVAAVLLVVFVSGCGLGVGWSSYSEDSGTSPDAPRSMPVEASPLGSFVDFARDPSEKAWVLASFADRVDLGLAGEPLVRRSADALKNPKAWELDTKLWRGGVGPFSALDWLGSYSGDLTVTEGWHGRCADPEPLPVPKALRKYEHWSIQPATVESCGGNWFSVDLFMRGGEIHAVTLDLYEP